MLEGNITGFLYSLGDIIRKVLAISKAESGTISLSYQPSKCTRSLGFRLNTHTHAAKISEKRSVPIFAMVATTVVSLLIGGISFASSVLFPWWWGGGEGGYVYQSAHYMGVNLSLACFSYGRAQVRAQQSQHRTVAVAQN